MTATTHIETEYGLSKRGQKNYNDNKGREEKLIKVLHNQYDEVENPDGVGEFCCCFYSLLF